LTLTKMPIGAFKFLLVSVRVYQLTHESREIGERLMSTNDDGFEWVGV